MQNVGVSITKRSTGDAAVCSCCEGPELAGWCEECMESLCAPCVEAHRRVKLTRSHTIRERPAEGAVTAAKPTALSYCPAHRSEVIQLYCSTCDLLTCRDCQLMDHRNHSFQFIHEVLSSQRQQIQVLVQRLWRQREQVKQSLLDLENRQLDIADSRKKVRRLLEKCLVVFYEMFKSSLNKINIGAQKSYLQEDEEIRKRRSVLKKLQEDQHDLSDLQRRILNQDDLPALCSYRRELEKVLSQDPRPAEFMTRVSVTIQTDFLTHMASFAQLSITPVPFSTLPRDQRPDNGVQPGQSDPCPNPSAPNTCFTSSSQLMAFLAGVQRAPGTVKDDDGSGLCAAVTPTSGLYPCMTPSAHHHTHTPVSLSHTHHHTHTATQPVSLPGNPQAVPNRHIQTSSVPLGMNQPVGGDNQLVGGDNQLVGGDNQPLGCDNQPVVCDNRPVGFDNRPVGFDNRPVGSDNQPIQTRSVSVSHAQPGPPFVGYDNQPGSLPIGQLSPNSHSSSASSHSKNPILYHLLASSSSSLSPVRLKRTKGKGDWMFHRYSPLPPTGPSSSQSAADSAQSQAPPVKALADSACDSTAPPVGERPELQPEDNHPSSTVSELEPACSFTSRGDMEMNNPEIPLDSTYGDGIKAAVSLDSTDGDGIRAAVSLDSTDGDGIKAAISLDGNKTDFSLNSCNGEDMVSAISLDHSEMLCFEDISSLLAHHKLLPGTEAHIDPSESGTEAHIDPSESGTEAQTEELLTAARCRPRVQPTNHSASPGQTAGTANQDGSFSPSRKRKWCQWKVRQSKATGLTLSRRLVCSSCTGSSLSSCSQWQPRVCVARLPPSVCSPLSRVLLLPARDAKAQRLLLDESFSDDVTPMPSPSQSDDLTAWSPCSSESYLEPLSSPESPDSVSAEWAVEPLWSPESPDSISAERAVEPLSSPENLDSVSAERAVEPLSSPENPDSVSAEWAVESLSSPESPDSVSVERAVEPLSPPYRQDGLCTPCLCLPDQRVKKIS